MTTAGACARQPIPASCAVSSHSHLPISHRADTCCIWCAGGWPEVRTLLLLKLWAVLFPASDRKHAVLSPAALLIGSYLANCRPSQPYHLATGAAAYFRSHMSIPHAAAHSCGSEPWRSRHRLCDADQPEMHAMSAQHRHAHRTGLMQCAHNIHCSTAMAQVHEKPFTTTAGVAMIFKMVHSVPCMLFYAAASACPYLCAIIALLHTQACSCVSWAWTMLPLHSASCPKFSPLPTPSSAVPCLPPSPAISFITCQNLSDWGA